MSKKEHNDSTYATLYLDLTALNPILHKLLDELRSHALALPSDLTVAQTIEIQHRRTLELFISALVDAYTKTGRPLDGSYAYLSLRELGERHERECAELKKAARDWKSAAWGIVLIITSSILLKLSF